MAPKSNGYFGLSSGHQGTSSRGLIKAQKEKCQSQTTIDAIKPSFVISHSQYSSKGILAIPSQGIFKRKFQNSLSSVSALTINLGNHTHSIEYGLINNFISFKNHENFIQPSSFPNLERYTLHQGVNPASRIQ
ncbi:hypothetical protein O181_049111 [Austropuccinia psidii MF-1]|uniref:Uncharacterized protein n=1 Tax=Austropuccinia psidii MF-1 TaxID=1389203 RepID=A0A9Q3HL19_9BASI|nr:hypothetical protein [Austropuccinia psidii MF-1]